MIYFVSGTLLLVGIYYKDDYDDEDDSDDDDRFEA